MLTYLLDLNFAGQSANSRPSATPGLVRASQISEDRHRRSERRNLEYAVEQSVGDVNIAIENGLRAMYLRQDLCRGRRHVSARRAGVAVPPRPQRRRDG